MNTDELKTILEQHKLWLEDEGGARAEDLGFQLSHVSVAGFTRNPQ